MAKKISVFSLKVFHPTFSILWMLSHALGGYFPNTQKKPLKIVSLISCETCKYCSQSLVYASPPLSYRLSRAVFQIISFVAYTLLWALISNSL